jgi:hypothetical protein
MTAGVIRFPICPVRVVPRADGGWLVEWRGCGWLRRARPRKITYFHPHAQIARRRATRSWPLVPGGFLAEQTVELGGRAGRH